MKREHLVFLILRILCKYYFSHTPKTQFIIKRYLMFTDYISESESSEILCPTFKTDKVAKISICSKGMSILGRLRQKKSKHSFFLFIVIATSMS